ncbi:hypothetical protein HGRIS_013600 [Hohenbuehelia grisea]|uniref:Timeless N-terminal domain-containing protein n=1 Tax=Hohenbuehelia grisea TaxID=104357 RepID=A0ABR3IW81_9AGAR
MADREVIEISDEESEASPDYDRRAIFEPVVRRVVDALGGYEGGHYRLGDEATGCLKDLKKLWRKDDTDDERTVARIFWETRVFMNDLVPILLETAGKGLVEDKRAIYCADLMTAMTWPIDMAEELKELDDEIDKGTDYTQLLQSHLYYKAALLKPGVIEALFGIMLPPLAKLPHERSERDGQVINVVLHLIRNLAFIKDLPANIHLSSDQAELSSMQSRLIRTLSETHTLSLLLTIAANSSNDRLLNNWNTLVLEIFYLLFRGVKPASLAVSQKKQPAENLKRLLAVEAQNRRNVARTASSRHSHFGTTISVQLNPKKKPHPSNDGNDADSEPAKASGSKSQQLVLHRQQALTKTSGSIIDMTKQQKTKRGKTLDELSREENLSLEARTVLQDLAKDFIEGCFNPFLASLLKDIRSERAKISEKDNLRLLFVTKWFLDFFLCTKAKNPGPDDTSSCSYGLVAEVLEREWIIWVLKRMRGAVDEKPKMWTELQAGIDCLAQLLLLVDGMTSSQGVDSALKDAAELLQQQLIYNGEVLDLALESLRSYKEGTQSLAYLDSSVYLAYSLLRMLERWGKAQGQEMYVRRKTAKARKRAKAKAAKEKEDAVPDVEDIEEESEDEEIVHETLFTFEAFQEKFAQADITQTLLTYLARYKDFSSSENMKRVVNLMHRQAVRAKAEGLYFKVSTLDLFKTILADQHSFPREQTYKDLLNLINYVLRQFFKALAENPFHAVEAFFPKNRGNWKQFSSWKPEPKATSRKGAAAEESKFPPDVEVKKGYSWSDQLGIAIAALVEAKQEGLIDWVKEILTLVIGMRQRIVEDTDNKGDDDDADDDPTPKLDGPSVEAMAKFTDYTVPCVSDEQAQAVTRNPHLKLLLRLSKFYVAEESKLVYRSINGQS